MTKIAFVFPGQGSQHVGMLAQLAESESLIHSTYDEASTVLGYDLWQLVQSGPEELLNQTDKTQPSLLVASVALWRIWQAKHGTAPLFMSGHSLGEYSALVCAGALSFADAVSLVELRGQFMQSAVPVGAGAMAAIIGLDDSVILDACAEASEGLVVEAVNFNSPGQVVIAGQKEAVDRAMQICKDRGAKRALPLSVSAPSHCQLMKPAAEQLAGKLESISISVPEIPVVQNVCAAVESDPEKIKANLVEQLFKPVLWVDCVTYMVSQGVEATIECGPGKVLSGLNKRIHKPLQTLAINDVTGIEAALKLGE
ncbi:ACP S-malonyltransferase [Gynuella sunshinyii]|uniref:Malonyl CoA-acyl carrier protein transacylase n=1 Tax=Gynuella sunshinyii YC6258 TaxID=1445510 RepID=A0A0C5VY67_9GAMM|nr:ACP S-malonyltransferase [Gynuella sunshinyii]AJQ95319.1 (acyl-carrier-protein) S-malonyltransferase [Gynuella sunshinyii YC6258]